MGALFKLIYLLRSNTPMTHPLLNGKRQVVRIEKYIIYIYNY